MKIFYPSLLLVCAIQLPVLAQEVTATDETKVDDGRTMRFPDWPPAAHEPFARSEFVPPPPGPYMSNALSPIESGFDNSGQRSPDQAESNQFGPEMSWPQRLHARPPKRWMPDEGYQYAPPGAQHTPLSRPYVNPAAQPYMPPQYYGWGPRRR